MADATVSGDFIVVLNDNVTTSEIDAMLIAYKDEIQVKHVYDMGSFKGFAGKMTENAVERLKQDPRVKYVENDQQMSICGTANAIA